MAPAVGTETDRASMDFRGSGDASQQDCVDEATNTTSYLLVLDRHGLIRYHAVERPFAKDNFGKWTHWAALIREKESGELFAVNSSASANGENPTVQSAASFYIPNSSGDTKPPGNFALRQLRWLARRLQRRGKRDGDDPLGPQTGKHPGTWLEAYKEIAGRAEPRAMPAAARRRARR